MFNKYSSITNVEESKYLFNADSALKYQVTEKLHGANFSFIVSGNKVRHASRKHMLNGVESFFNYKPVAESLEEAIKSLWYKIAYEYKDESTIIQVIGELYGANIQKEVKYYSDPRFAAFDIMVNGQYLDPLEVENMCEEYNIPHVPVLGWYSLQGAITLSNTFVTLCSDIQDENNICEGTVIKPSKIGFFNCGKRIIFKNKNSKFLEKSKAPKEKIKSELVGEDLKLYTELISCVNSNRITAVMSKESNISFTNFGTYIGLVYQDILDDLELSEVPKPIRKLITNNIAKELKLYLNQL